MLSATVGNFNCQSGPCQYLFSISFDGGIYVLPGGHVGGFLCHLRLAIMGANDAEYREFCRRLEGMGVDRKAIAAGMHQERSWVTRWMNGTRKRKINADEVKAFGEYLDRFVALLAKRPDTAPRAAPGTPSATVEVSPHAETGSDLEQSRSAVAASLLDVDERVSSSATKDQAETLAAVLGGTRRKTPPGKASRRTRAGKGDKSPVRRRKAH
jgi:hypothetical protein